MRGGLKGPPGRRGGGRRCGRSSQERAEIVRKRNYEVEESVTLKKQPVKVFLK